MSLTKRSWFPLCWRSDAMKEIAETSRRSRENETRLKSRHAEEEARFKDIIARIQGYIAPDGTPVMIQSRCFEDVEPRNIQHVGVRMETVGDSVTFYARVDRHFLQRYSRVLTPSDIKFVARYTSELLADEIATTMISGKVEY